MNFRPALFAALCACCCLFMAANVFPLDSVVVSVSGSTNDCRSLGATFSTGTTAQAFGRGAGATDSIDSGIRYQAIPIPRGKIIDSAVVEFVAKGNWSGVCNTTIHCEDTADAATFSTESDFNSRSRTTGSTSWSPSDWTDGVTYKTPNFAAAAQELLDRADWSSGNDLVVLFKDSWGAASGNRREGYSIDGSSTLMTKLKIFYHTPSASTPTRRRRLTTTTSLVGQDPCGPDYSRLPRVVGRPHPKAFLVGRRSESAAGGRETRRAFSTHSTWTPL